MKITNKQIKNTFANRLRYFMEKQNVSEQELADKARVLPDTVKRYLNEELTPSIRDLTNISHVLKIKMGDLIDPNRTIE